MNIDERSFGDFAPRTRFSVVKHALKFESRSAILGEEEKTIEGVKIRFTKWLEKFQIHGRRQLVCSVLSRNITRAYTACYVHIRCVWTRSGKVLQRGLKAALSRAKLSIVNYRVFCCRTRVPIIAKRRTRKRRGGARRRSARPASSQTRIRVRARTRFLHCCLAWIAGVRAPLIITICCRVRVSCYAALTRVRLSPSALPRH